MPIQRPLLALVVLLSMAVAGCKGKDENTPQLSLDAVHGAKPKHVSNVAGRKYFAYELADDFEKVRKATADQLAKEGWTVKDGASSFAGPGAGKSVEFVAIKRGRLTSDGLNVIPDAAHTVVTIYEPVGK